MTPDTPTITIGDTICITMELTRVQTEVDSGIQSPRMRIVDIRRDVAGVVEILVVRAEDA